MSTDVDYQSAQELTLRYAERTENEVPIERSTVGGVAVSQRYEVANIELVGLIPDREPSTTRIPSDLEAYWRQASSRSKVRSLRTF